MRDWKHPFTVEEMREQQLAFHDKYKGDNTVTQIPEEYAAKLRAPKEGEGLTLDQIIENAQRSVYRKQKQFQMYMPYEDARKVVWRICQAKSAVINKEFIVDEYNRAIIQDLIKYFIGDPECKYDLNKGLLLIGDVGRGKTYLMSVMKAFADAAEIRFRQFNFHTCADIADEVEESGNGAMRRYFNDKKDICFDDLGQESTTVKRYGNDLNVMERILTKRYANFVNGKCITHITTNLSREEIEQYYGSRVSDRFNEMFNDVFFPGPTRRL